VFPEFYAEYFRIQNLRTPPIPSISVCQEPIRYIGQSLIGRDIANLKADDRQNEGRGSISSRGGAFQRVSTLKNEHYASDRDLLMALADAMREEYRAIIDAGLMRQIDDAFPPFPLVIVIARAKQREEGLERPARSASQRTE